MRVLSSGVLAYIMLRPVSSGNILYPLLAVLAIASFATLAVRHFRASREVVSILGAVLLVALYGAAVGVGNPGWSQHVIVWTLGPLLYGMWALAADLRMLRWVLTTAIWTTIALSSMIILYVTSELGAPSVLPAWLIEETGARFNLEGDATAIGLYGLSTLVAAAPLCIIAAFVRKHPLLPSRAVRIAAAVLATVAALLGGRNAIVLVVVLVPLLVVIIRRLSRQHWHKVRIHPGAFLAVVGLITTVPFIFPAISSNPAVQRTWDNIVGFFANSGNQAARNSQIEELLNGWSQAFMFGHGFGATLLGYSRSEERPWNFEMQYHMLLFQLGIVGIILLIGIVLLSLRAIIRAGRLRPDLLAPLVVACSAAAGMLIANATNPYLQAPGHMWAIWLPLMVANAALCSTETSTNRSSITKMTGPKPNRRLTLSSRGYRPLN